MPTLTADMLKGGCADQVAEFEQRFPDGVTVETRGEAIAAAVAVADVFNWNWAARNLLSATAQGAYDTATYPAWKAYEAAMYPVWEVSRAAKASAFAAAWYDDHKLDANRQTEGV